MKVTKVSVADPRSRYIWQDPILNIQVDEPVFEQAEPVFDYKKILQYRYIPCGPFFAVEYRPDLGMRYGPYVDLSETKKADIGEVNTSGLLHEQLFPVTVITPDESIELFSTTRWARRMLRKYSLGCNWNIIVDEQAALRGLLKWRLELRYPLCYGGAKPGEANCAQPPTQTIMHKETHLTLCENHRLDHQARLAVNRSKSAR